jgi:hypothetical protein
LEALRNGSPVTTAYLTCGSQLLWYNNQLYILGDDAVTSWYVWNGSSFSFFGNSDPSGGTPSPSPSGTRIPPSNQIVDGSLTVWSLRYAFGCPAGNLEALQNGSPVTTAYLTCGSQLLWYNNGLYILGDDAVTSWYLWDGSSFSFFGNSDPSGGTTYDFRGTVLYMNGSCPSITFSAAGHRVYTNGSTAFVHTSCRTLKAGTNVHVIGVAANGGVLATSIDTK